MFEVRLAECLGLPKHGKNDLSEMQHDMVGGSFRTSESFNSRPPDLIGKCVQRCPGKVEINTVEGAISEERRLGLQVIDSGSSDTTSPFRSWHIV
jgi:hypothetical protein